MIGFGARHAELRGSPSASRSTGRAVPRLPAADALPLSLSTADVHFVGLARGLSGFVVPSRLYGILAAGRPVLVSADADSETVRLVEEVGCGIVVPPGRPELVASVIRDADEGRPRLVEMGDLGGRGSSARPTARPSLRPLRRVVADVVARVSR